MPDILRAVPILAVSLLAACAESPRLSPIGEGPKAPAGTDTIQDAVDGLVVGHRLMASGEYELALKAYLRAAAEQGLNVDVLSAIGSANLRLGRLGQAETMLRRAIEKDERFVPAWNNLGVVLMEQGKPAEAMLHFRTAFALDAGASPDIGTNLNRAIALTEDRTYTDEEESGRVIDARYNLVRRGSSVYRLLRTPEAE